MAKGVVLVISVVAMLGACTGTGRPPTLLETIAGCLSSGDPHPGGATARDLYGRRAEACADSCRDKRDACALFCGDDPDPEACRSRCDRGSDACEKRCAGPPPID